MLKLTSAKLTGMPGASGWSQVHEFTPDDPEKLNSRGHLFAVIATQRGESTGVDTITLGRELISRLHEEYFGDLTQKPFNALNLATQKVIDEFKNSWGDVEVAAFASVGDAVFSSAGGGSKVVICRDGALATILESGTDVVSASGFPKDGDVIMLATKAFFAKFPGGIIKAGLQNPDPNISIETFAPSIRGAEDAGTVAAVVVKFKNEVIEEVPVAIPIKVAAVTDVAKSIKNVFTKLLKRLPERKIYVNPAASDDVSSQSKKLSFSVAIILLIILAVSIGFGIRQKKINDLRKQYQGILTQAEEEVDQAISLASVSPDKSRELFTDSVQKLGQIEELKVKDPKVDELKKKINDSRAAILGEYLVSPELFLDLSLLSSGFKGDTLSFSGGNIFILDKAGKRIVSAAISTKKSKVVAGPTVIDEAADLAAYEDRVFVLASDGIYEVGSTKTKVIEKSWEGQAFIKAFAANLYVLDVNGNAIYRYSGNGSSFGDRQGWLSASTKPDFSGAVSWGIDGTVYVLFPNSKIQKFSLGSPQAFKVSGVIPDVGGVDALFADPDNQYLYLLDRAGKRVIVTDKKGVYKAQYIGDSIFEAVNLVVSEADKKIILLTGGKLLSIDIKNL